MERRDGAGEQPPPEIHVTAAEAYPAFERHVLGARESVLCAFRIFDLSTRLRTAEGQAVGGDWFDLILHVLQRGVAVRIVLSDFDGVVGEELHGMTWRTLRQVSALRELAPAGSRLDAHASLHPATIGMLPRLLLWPRVDRMLRDKAGRLLKMSESRRARFRSEHPNTSRLLMLDEDAAGPRRWPVPPLSPVTHHQKVAVIDDEIAYVGGLDLNERRWDTPAHDRPGPETWHDVHVTLRDPATAKALRRHVEEFEAVIADEAEPSDAGGLILRTLSQRRNFDGIRMSPRPVLSEIAEALHDAIARAERFVYVETQFLRDRRIAAALAERAREVPQLSLLAVVPAAPEDVAFEGNTRVDARLGVFLQTRALRKLQGAFGARLYVASPARRVTAQGSGPSIIHGAPLIYLHSKVTVVDDEIAVVGSANLNGRSLYWDTEVAVPIRGAAAGEVRRRCMSGILGPGDWPEEYLDPSTMIRAWRRLGAHNAATRPEERRGFVLPHATKRWRDFGQDVPGVPEEMV
ncbi:phospholipase [Jannaschia sp. Os4]|uniref:phospholipase D family protein n=1 Tax=Jannaschia sp. Os4 TaxID=2807617 RepID=UPI00193AC6EB|nr:phospholipase D-like domain-containing protein [Jannaschia sp. Os4]MBM2574887.1 phospholipase [Jannaschia sp. Os4]